MAEAGDFKFGTQLGFAQAHHKSSTGKVGLVLVCGFPQNLGLAFDISTLTEANDFKVGIRLGFAKADHSI